MVDTRNKRMAMLSFGRIERPTAPLPDSSGISTSGDRAQLIYRYRGIMEPDEGGGGVTPTPSHANHIPKIRGRRR